jgi:hypothetical protein
MLEKDENRYLKRFEAEFNKILGEISMLSASLPQYKTENESLRERICNIRGWAEAASKIRYMKKTDHEAVLANLITHILQESDDLDKLKPITPPQVEIKSTSDELFKLLAQSRNVSMDEAFKGFDFYDNNPYDVYIGNGSVKVRKKRRKKCS